MPRDRPSHSTREHARIVGVVQGVGFRPFLHRLAGRLGLTGRAGNDGSGAWVEVQGPSDRIDAFFGLIRESPPALARIEGIERQCRPWNSEESDFRIAPSAIGTDGTPPASVPADVAPCEACLREIQDPGNRRYRYPFTNCVDCGPRLTIIQTTPYDRSNTTLAGFPLCPACASEYHDPADRRFHAEPVACPACGPTVWWVPASEGHRARERPDDPRGFPCGDAALTALSDAIAGGMIVAIQGVGGFHLACDAQSEEAVARIREHKRRPEKPFAVLVASVEMAMRYVEAAPVELRLLESRERPIVLLRRKTDAPPLAGGIAPGLDRLGIILPDSPLHHLICPTDRPIVFTSGNLGDEPIARTNPEALERLRGLADGFLLHNRPIVVACDDSVVKPCPEVGPILIRRSRGFAPLPIEWPWSESPPTLAVGAELKAAFALTRGSRAWLSPHVGDVGQVETLEALARSVQHFESLFRTRAERIVADLHPGYVSTAWARGLAEERGVPLVQVQHHHAHAAACLVEHGWPDDGTEALAVVLDGSGYGSDGTVWGGELLRVTYATFDRIGHLAEFPLPGGDLAVKRPYRAALALLRTLGFDWQPALPCVAACPWEECRALEAQLESRLGCIPTTSAGRLFDAVASLLGVRQVAGYEGQPAAELEALAATCEASGPLPTFAIIRRDDRLMIVDPAPVLRFLIEGLRKGTRPSSLARAFHEAFARMIGEWAAQAADATGNGDVILSGGVFQNALLLRLAVAELEDRGLRPWTHRRVPPNDGGLALGQAAVASARARLLKTRYDERALEGRRSVTEPDRGPL